VNRAATGTESSGVVTWAARRTVSGEGKRWVKARGSRKAKRIRTAGLADARLLEQLAEVVAGAFTPRGGDGGERRHPLGRVS